MPRICLALFVGLILLSGCGGGSGGGLGVNPTKKGFKQIRFSGCRGFEVPDTWTSDAPENGDAVDIEIQSPEKGIIEAHFKDAMEAAGLVAMSIDEESKTDSKDVKISGRQFHKDTYTGKDENGAAVVMSAYVGDAGFRNSDTKYIFICRTSQPSDLPRLEKIVESFDERD